MCEQCGISICMQICVHTCIYTLVASRRCEINLPHRIECIFLCNMRLRRLYIHACMHAYFHAYIIIIDSRFGYTYRCIYFMRNFPSCTCACVHIIIDCRLIGTCIPYGSFLINLCQSTLFPLVMVNAFSTCDGQRFFHL